VRAITTGDGSVTLERVDSGWAYRSRYGASHESRTVFVEGSAVLAGPRPRVLEFGFGAGTNFAETVRCLRSAGHRELLYCAIDEAPVAVEDLPAMEPEIHELVMQGWQFGRAANEGVTLETHRCGFADFTHDLRFDAIYFDPFGPSEQPDSWSTEVFRIARAHAQPEARLVTYSVAGWIRRNLAEAGFFVATATGALGKREFTIASPARATLWPHRIRHEPR